MTLAQTPPSGSPGANPTSDSPGGEATPVLQGPVTRRTETTARSLFGLLVIWLALFLVFKAHILSDTHITFKTQRDGGAGLSLPPALVRALDTPVLMLQTLTAQLPDRTPRQALINLRALGLFEVSDAEVETFLGDARRSFEFNGVPLYQVIHQLLDNPAHGFALRGRNLILFNQALEAAPTASFDWRWRAQLELSETPLLVFPSSTSDVWFNASITGPADQPQDQWNTVVLEIWKGNQRLTLARTVLDEQGNGQINLTSIDSLAFAVQRAAAPADRRPGRYNLEFYYLALRK